MNELLERYPQLGICKNGIAKAVEKIVACYENGGKVLICGNGGSCADSDHVVGELMKGFLKKRPIPPAKKSEMTSENLRGQIQEYLEDAARARTDAEISKREAERLAKELASTKAAK